MYGWVYVVVAKFWVSLITNDDDDQCPSTHTKKKGYSSASHWYVI